MYRKSHLADGHCDATQVSKQKGRLVAMFDLGLYE